MMNEKFHAKILTIIEKILDRNVMDRSCDEVSNWHSLLFIGL